MSSTALDFNFFSKPEHNLRRWSWFLVDSISSDPPNSLAFTLLLFSAFDKLSFSPGVPDLFFVQTFLTFPSILGSFPPVLLVLKFLFQLSPNPFFSSPEYSKTCSHKCTQYNQLYLSKPVLATVGQFSCRHNSRQCIILPDIKSCTSPQPEFLNTWYHLQQIKNDASE